MKSMIKAAIFLVASITGMQANAGVIPTTFDLGSNVFTMTGSDGFNTLANDTDWFVFEVTQDSFVDLDINRLQAEPDVIAALYLGDVTGADFGTSTIGDLNYADVSPLTHIQTQDDTEQDNFGGPYGDPRFSLNLGAGIYSVAIWGFFGGGTGLDVEFVATGDYLQPQNVPEPTSLAILALGALGLVSRRIKK